MLYDLANGGQNAIWSTGTDGYSGARFDVQTDGDLIVYSQGNVVLWSSDTANLGDAELHLQSDGNLVFYDIDGNPVWSRP